MLLLNRISYHVLFIIGCCVIILYVAIGGDWLFIKLWRHNIFHLQTTQKVNCVDAVYSSLNPTIIIQIKRDRRFHSQTNDERWVIIQRYRRLINAVKSTIDWIQLVFRRVQPVLGSTSLWSDVNVVNWVLRKKNK